MPARPPLLHSFVSFVLALVCVTTTLAAACASSKTAAPPASAASAKKPEPPLPPVPTDPLALLPLDTSSLVIADATALSKLPDFATWRGWAERYACIARSDLDWLTANTARGLLAARGKSPSVQGLAILAGKYTDADAGRALSLLEPSGAAIGAPVTMQQRGRFTLSTRGPISATQLEGRLLLVGDTAFVQAALDTIEAPPPTRLSDAEPFHRVSERLGCSSRAVCMLTAADSSATHALKRLLAGVGMKGLGRELAQAASGLSVDVASGVAFAGSIELGSEDQARSVEKQINDWLWQAGVFARLAGFPDVLDEIEVKRSEPSVVELQLRLDDATRAKLEKRVSEMLEDTTEPCTATASTANQSTL